MTRLSSRPLALAVFVLALAACVVALTLWGSTSFATLDEMEALEHPTQAESEDAELSQASRHEDDYAQRTGESAAENPQAEALSTESASQPKPDDEEWTLTFQPEAIGFSGYSLLIQEAATSCFYLRVSFLHQGKVVECVASDIDDFWENDDGLLEASLDSSMECYFADDWNLSTRDMSEAEKDAYWDRFDAACDLLFANLHSITVLELINDDFPDRPIPVQSTTVDAVSRSISLGQVFAPLELFFEEGNWHGIGRIVDGAQQPLKATEIDLWYGDAGGMGSYGDEELHVELETDRAGRFLVLLEEDEDEMEFEEEPSPVFGPQGWFVAPEYFDGQGTRFAPKSTSHGVVDCGSIVIESASIALIFSCPAPTPRFESSFDLYGYDGHYADWDLQEEDYLHGRNFLVEPGIYEWEFELGETTIGLAESEDWSGIIQLAAGETKTIHIVISYPRMVEVEFDWWGLWLSVDAHFAGGVQEICRSGEGYSGLSNPWGGRVFFVPDHDGPCEIRVSNLFDPENPEVLVSVEVPADANLVKLELAQHLAFLHIEAGLFDAAFLVGHSYEPIHSFRFRAGDGLEREFLLEASEQRVEGGEEWLAYFYGYLALPCIAPLSVVLETKRFPGEPMTLTTERTIGLQPGWNSIELEAIVFEELPRIPPEWLQLRVLVVGREIEGKFLLTYEDGSEA